MTFSSPIHSLRFASKSNTHSILLLLLLLLITPLNNMKLTNVVLTASAASLVSAYPRGRPAVPSDQSIAKKRANGFTWVGVNESGAEFGQTNLPGTLGTDYTWPDTSKIQVLRDAGMNVFRIPFLMERLVPDSLTGTTDSTYLSALQSVSNEASLEHK